jgi:hypothetical protein
LVGWWSKTLTVGASILIKPNVAFNRGDTFVFGSWVCIVNGAGSFQRRLTMTPNPKTGLVMLLEVITSTLAGKIGEILLYNQHANFEYGSTSNSNSTPPRVVLCDLAPEPSCEIVPLHQAGREIASDYSSESNPASGYYSDSSYEFDFGSDPIESMSEIKTTAEPMSGPATGLVITSTPGGRFIYWLDRKPGNLTDGNSRCVT